MKSLLVAITAGALTMSSMGQGIASTTVIAGSELTGIDLVAELNQSINSKKARLGDPVKATISQDVILHGKIVIRRGSKLFGYVTEVKARNREDQESRLGMIFDRAAMKGGQEINLSAAVRALAPPVRHSAVDKPDMMAPPPLGVASASGSMQPVSGASRGIGTASGRTAGNPANNSTLTANQAARMAEYASASYSSGPESSLMGGGSRGVFGLSGLKLTPAAKGQGGSVISSTAHDVKLDSGTQLVLQVTSSMQ
jgi:hypothetical protein